MILEHGRARERLEGEEELVLDGHVLHWRGLAYLPGAPAGAPSLAACDWGSGLEGVRDAARALKGSFVVSVRARDGGAHYVFTDAGGNLQSFVSATRASTSLLQLCAVERLRFADVDPVAVAELVDLGNVYGGRTLFEAIRSTEPGRIYELRPDAPPVEHEVALPHIAVPPRAGFTTERFFADLSASLAGLRVSVDLTGGTDSRLVAASLAKDLDLECAITGVPGNADIAIAREVAEALGRPLYVTEHHVGDLEADLPDLFEVSDGLSDVLAYHRLRPNALARRARGVQVALGGMGGGLFKEFLWLQDFPLYRSRRSNLERLFDLRFRPVAVPAGMLAGEYAAAAGKVRERMLRSMRELVMPINTQTYDRVFYEMKERTFSTRFASMNSRFFAFDSPLLDPELIRLGFALPRSRRFFNRWHRQTLTAVNPVAARVRSTEGGMSVSAEPVRQVADTVVYGRDKARRLAAKVEQRLHHAPLPHQRPDHPELVVAARGTRTFRSSVERLAASGVLAPDGPLPDRYVGRVMTLGLLHERLEG